MAAGLAAPAPALARDFAISSFDGTRIEAHFFPAPSLFAGQPAPTVLVGPGWGNSGATNDDKPSSEADGTTGIGPIRRAGYNVLTWDPRGFGGSGGDAKLDSPHFEARDVQELLNTLALMPEAKLDGPGDPRVGMAGASYGGGVQWVAAAIDSRIDAIVPGSSWHSLVTSLYKDGAFKAGWGGYLCGTGAGQGVSTGLVNSGGVEAGSMDPHVYSICQSGLAAGRMLDGDRAWLEERGPGVAWGERVKAPTLILAGTVDTLFTPAEAIENYAVLRANDVPVRMMWFCGGHGACLTSRGFGGYIESAVLRWFGHYLREEQLTYTGPRFEWIDQYGGWHGASDYPLAPDGELTATGSGTLHLTAGDTSSSGTAITATPAVNGVDVPVRPPERTSTLVGTPRLELEYSGQGTASSTHAFAQIVDTDRNIVVGGQATPIPLRLDGQTHSIERPLEPVARLVWTSSSFKLQIVPATNLYGRQRANGTVQLKRISLRLPLGKDPVNAPPPQRCEPAFSPASVRRRSGWVRLTPRVVCAGQALSLRLTITGGRRSWSGRTGERAALRVRPRARRLIARFSHDGRAYRVKIRIRR